MADRSHWTQRRLQASEAYLRRVIAEGEPKIYDVEESRLLLLDVQQEIDRRKADGSWVAGQMGEEKQT